MSWTTTTMTATTSWEDLRKRSRNLENEVDIKLTNLNKLGVSLGGQGSRFNYSGGRPDEAPLLSSQNSFDSLTEEIAGALGKLTEINDQMAELVAGMTTASSPVSSATALHHTLQRHRDILHDYSNVFHKTRTTIQARMDREQLLGANTNRDEPGGLNNRRSDGYLKEHEHAKSSDRLLDEQISIAISTKEHIQTQRRGLRDITKKIDTITKRYPALNSLMQKISIKKRRDSLVIAAVITVCLILMFLWIWS